MRKPFSIAPLRFGLQIHSSTTLHSRWLIFLHCPQYSGLYELATHIVSRRMK
ncbi:hypothetical protein STEG23_004552, partial [Scotinomys teguina]